MCITESLCCTAEINTTLQINYTSIKFLKMKKSGQLIIYRVFENISLIID